MEGGIEGGMDGQREGVPRATLAACGALQPGAPRLRLPPPDKVERSAAAAAAAPGTDRTAPRFLRTARSPLPTTKVHRTSRQRRAPPVRRPDHPPVRHTSAERHISGTEIKSSHPHNPASSLLTERPQQPQVSLTCPPAGRTRPAAPSPTAAQRALLPQYRAEQRARVCMCVRVIYQQRAALSLSPPPPRSLAPSLSGPVHWHQ